MNKHLLITLILALSQTMTHAFSLAPIGKWFGRNASTLTIGLTSTISSWAGAYLITQNKAAKDITKSPLYIFNPMFDSRVHENNFKVLNSISTKQYSTMAEAEQDIQKMEYSYAKDLCFITNQARTWKQIEHLQRQIDSLKNNQQLKISSPKK